MPNSLATLFLPSRPPYWDSISVEVSLQTPHIITGMYRHPNNNIDDFKTHIKPYLKKKSHIIMGDLNAKHPLWGNKTTNRAGIWIAQQTISVVVPEMHTFAMNNHFSIIDIPLTQKQNCFTDIYTPQSLSTSEHHPVIYTFNPGRITPPQSKHIHFNYSTILQTGMPIESSFTTCFLRYAPLHRARLTACYRNSS